MLTKTIPRTSTAVAVINSKEAQILQGEDKKSLGVELQKKCFKTLHEQQRPLSSGEN